MTWMPAFRKAFAGPGVHVVRRDDRHRLDAVGSRGFRLGHLLVTAVGTVAGDAELERRGDGALRLRRQRAGDQFVVVVDARRDAVDRADEGALPAADHAEADAAAGLGVTSSLNHLVLP
jgi:hypothetical protein